MLARAKAALVGRLARAIEEHQRRTVHGPAEVDPSACVHLEARLQNPTDDAHRIRIGAHTHVLGRLLVHPHGGVIDIGTWSYVGHRTDISSMASVHIGDRVLIAHDVNIFDNTAHPRDAGTRHRHHAHIVERGHPLCGELLEGIGTSPVVIEDDVWISFGVSVLRGVRIGAGSIIAAGATVTHDVPPGVLYRCEVRPIMTPLQG
ncbi:MAG: acyltransferase [Chthonomonadales bacterium]|nr:acyltransferase [Chthonomonadales bacterium]